MGEFIALLIPCSLVTMFTDHSSDLHKIMLPCIPVVSKLVGPPGKSEAGNSSLRRMAASMAVTVLQRS